MSRLTAAALIIGAGVLGAAAAWGGIVALYAVMTVLTGAGRRDR